MLLTIRKVRKTIKKAGGTFKERLTARKSNRHNDDAAILANGTNAETDKIQSISDALVELQTRVDQFQTEIDMVTREMIGITNENVLELKQSSQGE